MLAIMVMGLFVLFSASDSDWDTVNRQIRNLVIGYGIFLVARKSAPIRFKGGRLHFTSVPCFCCCSSLSGWVVKVRNGG